ncbi:MAG: hypothetical protein EA397_05960 [Deltaproteobacteria bacterium]|nr:MAG: hypothetical protein EA397_05960 [Deltaproteobacteria bacterium]
MAFAFTAAERAMIDQIPSSELDELAAELEIVLPATVDRHDLLRRILPAMLERIAEEGLPLSRFNKTDLEELSSLELDALGHMAGHKGRVTPDALIRTCKKACRHYRRNRPRSTMVLILPLLLAPLVRAASASDLA